MSRLLIVDDESAFPGLARAILGEAHTIDVATSMQEALERLDKTSYDLVLTDLHMQPGASGIDLITAARERELDVPFLLVTGHATIETAVQAMRQGAFDYLRKSISPGELRAVVQRAIEHGRLSRELHRLRSEVETAFGADDRPVGKSSSLTELLALAERVANSDASVLITGESGTGKERLSRFIHRMSHRRKGPFVAFDCSALAPSLVESELFGHERGAFTGAERARRGLFREAQGGTLFLDEIGDVAPEVQTKLLRVLQEREVKPVGGDQFVKVDVRIVAATNKDLTELVQRGRFREDLYYRLAVVPLRLPPLRDRREDIPQLVEHILGRRRGAGPRPRRISDKAMQHLQAYGWPGNIRELENVIERAAILSDGVEIGLTDLPRDVLAAAPLGSPTEPGADPSNGGGQDGGAPSRPAEEPDVRPLKQRVAEAVRAVERQALLSALAAAGSPTRAAEALGISRASFYQKLKEHGLPTG